MANEAKSESSTPKSVFDSHIYTNTDEKPEVIYNACAYAAIFNRVKGSLMTQMDNADSTAFDRSVKEFIQKKLSGSRAEVEQWLDSLGFKGMFKMYDDGVINSETRGKIKASDYDYACSVDNFLLNIDKYSAKAKYLTDAKYAGQQNAPPMLTIPDIIEVLSVKRTKSDFAFFSSNKSLINNVGGYSSDGKLAGGPIVKAMNNAFAKAEGFRRNRRINFWKAFGWGILGLGAGIVTGGLGLATLGLGGQVLSGLLGALYTAGIGGFLGGAVVTVLAGWGALTAIGKFIGRVQLNIKNRIKERQYLKSEGKYALAAEDDWENMGYRRLKMKRDEALAIDSFYKNYEDGKPVTKRKDGKYEPIDYVPKKYRKAFMRYVNNEMEKHGSKARTIKTLFTNAKHHRFVHAPAESFKENQVGFYKLESIIRSGSYEAYMTSDLTADEAIINYGTGIDPKTHVPARLHPDMIKNHKDCENSLQYIVGNLKEFSNYEKKFNDANMHGDYIKGLKVFAECFNPAFVETVFDEPYSTSTVSAARDLLEQETVKKMFTDAGVTYNQTYMDGMLKFLEMESSYPINFGSDYSGDRYTSVDGSIGTSAASQLVISKESLKNGCQTLNKDIGTSADAIIDLIFDPTKSRTDLEALKATISSTFASDPKIAKYLILMLDKVKSARKYSESELKSMASVSGLTLSATDVAKYDSIITKISNLKLSSDIVSIYKDISGLDDAKFGSVKQKLEDALEAQIHTLHCDENNKIKENALHAIKGGCNKEFTEYLTKIKDLDNITDDATYSTVQKLLEDINHMGLNIDLKNYLLLKLRQRVTELFIKESGLDKYRTTGKDSGALEHIRKYLRLANAYNGTSIIDKAQLYEIINKMSPNIKLVVENDLYYAKLGYVTDYSRVENLKNLTTSGYSGSGLQEYFEMGTTDTEDLKDNIDRVTQSSTFKRAISFSFEGSQVKPFEEEGKACSLIYFSKKRDGSDELNGVISDMLNLRNKATSSDFNKYISTGTLDKYFDQLKALYDRIMAMSDPNDKYAALMLLKNEVLTHFMHHSVAYLKLKGATYGNYQAAILATGVAKDYPTDVADMWTSSTGPHGGMISMIEDALDLVKPSTTYDHNREYAHTENAKKFVAKCTSSMVDQALTNGERTLGA